MSSNSIPQRRPNEHWNLGAAVMSQRDVATALGISYQEVHYIERKALKKLRRILRERMGADYFEAAA